MRHRYFLLGFLLATFANGQAHNYTQGDVEEGGRQYRTNCIGCHGPEGSSVGGIDLGRARFRRVSSDEEIANAILNGVPGTGMPGTSLSSARAYAVVAYVRSMSSPNARKSIAALTGDAARGKALFENKGGCAACHRVRGQGGRPGPDLSEAGLSLRAIEIEASILDPDEAFSTSTRPFRAVKKDGSVVAGMLMNQNTYSVQLIDGKGALLSLSRSDLKTSEILAKSPMPSYRGKLDAQELADLISFVGSQKGAQ